MKKYYEITIIGNRANIKTLEDFKKVIVKYFKNVKGGMMIKDLIENDKARAARVEINKLLKKAIQIIHQAGVSTSIYYSPPPAIGGVAGNIDLIHNMFNLRLFDLEPKDIIDPIERAIGVYEHDKTSSVLRTINPFFWINKLFRTISRIPFYILGSAGFPQNKIENSLLGRITKMLLYLVQVGASFLVILQMLDYLDDFKKLIGLT